MPESIINVIVQGGGGGPAGSSSSGSSGLSKVSGFGTGFAKTVLDARIAHLGSVHLTQGVMERFTSNLATQYAKTANLNSMRILVLARDIQAIKLQISGLRSGNSGDRATTAPNKSVARPYARKPFHAVSYFRPPRGDTQTIRSGYSGASYGGSEPLGPRDLHGVTFDPDSAVVPTLRDSGTGSSEQVHKPAPGMHPIMGRVHKRNKKIPTSFYDSVLKNVIKTAHLGFAAKLYNSTLNFLQAAAGNPAGLGAGAVVLGLIGERMLTQAGHKAAATAQDRINFKAGVAFPDFVRQAQSAQNPLYSGALVERAALHDTKSRQVGMLLASGAGVGKKTAQWISDMTNGVLIGHKPMHLSDVYQKEVIATLENSFDISMQLSGSLAQAMGIPMTTSLTAAAKRNAVSTALAESAWKSDPLGKMVSILSNAGALYGMGAHDSGQRGVEYQYAAARALYPDWVAGVEEKARIDLQNKELKARLQNWKDNEARAASAIADPKRSFKRQTELRSDNFIQDMIWPKAERIMSEFTPLWGSAH